MATSTDTPPTFYLAFATLENTFPPPAPTHLLKDTPHITLVPANPSANPLSDTLQSELLDAILDEADAPDTLIHLRPTHSTHLPSSTFTLFPSSMLPTNAVYHATTLFDLTITLRHMYATQKHAIRILRIRWTTAQCILWESYHLSHPARTASRTLRLLTGLNTLEIDVEGRDIGGLEVRAVEEDVGNWLGELEMKGEMGEVEVRMLGGKEKRGWWGASGRGVSLGGGVSLGNIGWGWGGLGG